MSVTPDIDVLTDLETADHWVPPLTDCRKAQSCELAVTHLDYKSPPSMYRMLTDTVAPRTLVLP